MMIWLGLLGAIALIFAVVPYIIGRVATSLARRAYRRLSSHE